LKRIAKKLLKNRKNKYRREADRLDEALQKANDQMQKADEKDAK